ncbi:UNVERIFIED_CONTAM: hypothetical protein HDU68_010908 [Siphonaria sp. JEL0065]|nr:hypothetical protein HDU68_010908 [Siphonaria sp. JEL0065]
MKNVNPENPLPYTFLTTETEPDSIGSGLMVFRPNSYHFDKLKHLATVPTYHSTEYSVFRLFKAYFSSIGGLDTSLDPGYSQTLINGKLPPTLAINKNENNVIGIHHNFWVDYADPELFAKFSIVCDSVRRRQMKALAEGDQQGIVVPVVPLDAAVWQKVRDSGAMMDTILLLSKSNNKKLGGTLLSTAEIKKRDAIANSFSQQANHELLATKDSSNVIQSLQKIVDSLTLYDWVWILEDGLAINGNFKEPLHVLLGSWKKTSKEALVFSDCDNTRTASILLNKAVLSRLHRWMSSLKKEGSAAIDGIITEMLVRNLKGAWKVIDVENGKKVYSYDQKSCETFPLLGLE